MSEAHASAAPRPRPLFAALGRALEATLDRLLALDPQSAAALGALEGRSVTIDLGAGLPPLRLAVAAGRLRVGPDDAAADLRVRTSPSSLVAFALARAQGGALPAGRVEIAGDAALARQLEQLVSRFAPDVEEAFTRVFGDVAGVALARGLRHGLHAVRTGARDFVRDGAEFLTEEGRDLVARAELEAFGAEVDELAVRADRLAARLRRLSTQPGSPAA